MTRTKWAYGFVIIVAITLVLGAVNPSATAQDGNAFDGQDSNGAGMGTIAPESSNAEVAPGQSASRQSASGEAAENSVAKEASGSGDEVELSPRETYNAAIGYLRTDPDRCESMLGEARQAAGIDGELRFRCLYNLGWVEVVRADGTLENEPEKALAHLEMAASRFRESIRIRKDSTEARQNLEIVSRRILALRDTLAEKNPEDISQRLDAIIESQRAHQAELQNTTSVYADQPFESEEGRKIFRQLGVTQRQIISDLQKLAEDASQEAASASQATPDEPPDQAQQVRAAQLAAMLRYVESCQQRMGKARSFTRRQQAERAFFRWSAALTDAKRARDQLRDPIEVLGILISDASDLAQLTQLYSRPSQLTGLIPQGADAGAPTSRPPWLSLEYLDETQAATTQRTAELKFVLESGVEQNEEAEQSTEAGSVADNEQMDFLLASIKEALPDIDSAQQQFEKAGEWLGSEDALSAFQQQAQAIASLINAAEYFYDLRRMIEAVYADEKTLKQIAEQVTDSPEFVGQAISIGRELQKKNSLRAERLKVLLEKEKKQVLQSRPQMGPTGAGGSAPEPEAANEELERQKQMFEIADEILRLATEEMNAVESSLESLQADWEQTQAAQDSGTEANPAEQNDEVEERPPSPDRRTGMSEEKEGSVASPLEQVAAGYPEERIEKVVGYVEDLRRLFFSAIEHLRETAQRQAELNDEVTQMAGLNQELSPEEAGPFSSRQKSLEQISQQLSEVFREQAEQTQAAADPTAMAQGVPSGVAPPAAAGQQVDPEQAAAQAEALLEASKLIRDATQSMNTASESLGQAAADSEKGTQAEDVAASVEEAASSKSEGTAPDKSQESVVTEPPSDVAETKIDLDKIQESQKTALQKLAEALALLDQQQNDQQQNDQKQNQDQNQEQQQNQQNQQNEQQQQNMSANQMLQAIRDREAQRRKDKQQNVVGSGGVEKDW